MEYFRGFPAKWEGRPLRVGIVGMGKMGQLRAGYIMQDPRLHLSAVCDVRAEALDLPSNVMIFHDYHDLVATDLDIVYACAFNWLLPDIAIAALKSGKHVFCEKPPGRNADDVQRIMAEELRHPNLRVAYGFNHRQHYSVMKAKELIKSGKLGELLWMRGVYGKCGGQGFESVWRNQPELTGGGILLDQGIHMLDLFRYFGLEATEIKSFVNTSFWNINVEDNAFVLLSDGRRHAMLHSSSTQWEHRFQLEIGLTDGFIELNGLLTGTRSYGEESITWGQKNLELTKQILGRPSKETMTFNQDDSWAWEQENWVNSVRTGTSCSVNSHEAYKTLALVDAIYSQG